MYGFPVHTLGATERQAFLHFLPAAVAQRKEIANGYTPSTRESVERHVFDLTGSWAVADAAGCAWQAAQQEAEMKR